MNVSQLTNTGPNIGYFFLLLLSSILLAAFVSLFFSDWWHATALKWRDWVEPGHDCAPRQPLFIGSLILMTLWAGYRRTANLAFINRFRTKLNTRRNADPAINRPSINTDTEARTT